MSLGTTGWMRLLCASAVLVAGCTGRVPGTGAPARSRPGVVYETVRVPQPQPARAPEIAPPQSEYAAPPTGQAAYAEVPSYPSEPAAVPAHAPAMPVPAAMASAGTRDQQLAILTEAVGALRAEISRSYTYSQELVEETKKLRAQLRTMRVELEKTRGENEKLRAQVRTLERQLKEIRIAPPVQGQAAPPAAAAAPSAAPPSQAAPADPAPAPAAQPADAIPEPPVVEDRGVPADQDPELLDEENTPPSP